MAQHPFRFGVVAGQARSSAGWITTAQRAETFGYSTLLIPDTLGQTFAPFPALAVAAAVTQRLRVGTYVLANGYRNPVLVARESATLDFLSGGRFELGIGAGRAGSDADYQKLGIPFDAGGARVEQLAEALTLIKALLSGEQAPGPGHHYASTGADVFPRPAQQPRPPILVAAAGKRLIALAAREADIIALAVPADAGVEKFARTVDVVREAAGARFEQIELNINLIGVGSQIPPWITARMGYDAASLLQSGSPSVLLGDADAMCDQLRRQREALGVSYINVSDMQMEALAPVVARLAGR